MSRALFSWIIILLFFAYCPANSAELRLRTAVEKDTVAVGEPFIWQLRVEGTTRPELPALEKIRALLPDFTVTFLGIHPQTSSSTYIFNGHKTVNESKSAIINYQLSARKTGDFILPSVTLNADGQKLSSRKVAIRVTLAEKNPDFIIEAHLPRTEVYVGETFNVPVKLFFRANLNTVNFSVPLAEMDAFRVTLPTTPQADAVAVPINGHQAIARQGGREKRNGREFVTLTSVLTVRAVKAGEFAIPAATVNGAFGGDGFFSRSERFFTSDEPQTVTVKAIPLKGRPADFNGLIGDFKLAATVEPASAAIGDPLTLTVMVTGEGFLGDVELPDLSRDSAFTADFRIPAERADGKMVNGAKVFTQTLRAANTTVKAVPPVKICFFNPATGKFAYAASAPCPVSIRPAAQVAVSALEGFTPATAGTLENAEQSLAPNFVGEQCLIPEPGGNRYFARWQWLTIIALPLLFTIAVTGKMWQERRRASAARRQARGALGVFARRLEELQQLDNGLTELPNALREYFAQRFGLNSAALTFADIEPLLSRKVSPAMREKLRQVVNQAEAARYAVNSAPARLDAATAEAAFSAVSAVD